VIVFAFASLQTIMRLKVPLLTLRDAGTTVSLVVGLDMGGTSKEVLRELSTWNVNVTVVKNRIPGHTFHPKLYLLEWESLAKVVVGSNNATEGGFYRNYEVSSCTEYDLPADSRLYAGALRFARRAPYATPGSQALEWVRYY
jgi:HKD family nuclease